MCVCVCRCWLLLVSRRPLFHRLADLKYVQSTQDIIQRLQSQHNQPEGWFNVQVERRVEAEILTDGSGALPSPLRSTCNDSL